MFSKDNCFPLGTITRLEETGAKIYNTKDLGTIHISSDGDKININNIQIFSPVHFLFVQYCLQKFII